MRGVGGGWEFEGGGGRGEGARNSVSVLLIVKCGMERQLPHKYPSYRELSNIGGSLGTHHNSALGTLHVKNAASEPQIRNKKKTV